MVITKLFVFCIILSFLFLSGEDKVHLKVEEIGLQGRKEIIINKIDSKFKLIKVSNEVSEYELLISKKLKVKIFQYGGDVADMIKIGDSKYTVGESVNPLVQEEFNPKFLSVDMIEVYTLKYKDKKYLTMIAKSAGAAGKAINYSLYQIFDITNDKRIKYYPATSYYGDIKNITDLNKDGKLDFLKVKEKHESLYEMKAFEIFSGMKKNITGKSFVRF